MTDRLDLTRATKGELLDEVVRLRAEVDRPAVPARELDDEARAVDRCVAALEPLRPRASLSTYGAYRGTDEILRVLRYLADRYGVPLVETVREVEPCDRRHVDELGLVDLSELARRV